MKLLEMATLRQKMHFHVPVERAAQRFRELIIYISAKSINDPHFGDVKLNKTLYYSDFRAFERFGIPLTGAKYLRLKAGPAPRALLPVREKLKDEGAIRVDLVDINGFKQHRTVAIRDPIMVHFTPDEILIVDEVIRDLWDQTATEVSDASHDVRWRTLQDKDDMPYEFAFLSNEEISEKEIERTGELAKEFGWGGEE